MLRFRKFLCECFGLVALLFLLVSTSTIPSLLRRTHARGFPPAAQSSLVVLKLISLVIVVLSKLLLLMPLVLAVLYAMAWWTVRKHKPSARAWSIAASLAMLLLSIPVSVTIFYVRHYAPRPFLIFDAFVLALAIAGLVAFAPRDSLTQSPTHPAPSPRIAGDGTSTLVDALTWVLQIAGYLAAIAWWRRWGHAHGLPPSRHFLLQLLIAGLLTSALHEFGHAATGRAFGMRLRAFIVGPFQWRIRDGRWKFQFLPSHFLSSGGSAAVVPTNPEQSRHSVIAMIAAGAAANLCSGLIAAGLALTAHGKGYEPAWWFLALVATLSLVSCVVNLIPIRPQAMYSDGARIFQLLSGGPWADLHRALSIASATLVTPLRPRDYDIQTIQRASCSFPHGHRGFLLRLLAASHFLDTGSIPQAREALAGAEAIYRQSPAEIPAGLHTAFVVESTLLGRDPACTRLWWRRMETKKPAHLGVDYWLARSALLWIENRPQESREAWTQANLLAQRLPSAGAYEFDRLRCTLMRRALDQPPPAEPESSSVFLRQPGGN